MSETVRVYIQQRRKQILPSRSSPSLVFYPHRVCRDIIIKELTISVVHPVWIWILWILWNISSNSHGQVCSAYRLCVVLLVKCSLFCFVPSNFTYSLSFTDLALSTSLLVTCISLPLLVPIQSMWSVNRRPPTNGYQNVVVMGYFLSDLLRSQGIRWTGLVRADLPDEHPLLS